MKQQQFFDREERVRLKEEVGSTNVVSVYIYVCCTNVVCMYVYVCLCMYVIKYVYIYVWM